MITINNTHQIAPFHSSFSVTKYGHLLISHDVVYYLSEKSHLQISFNLVCLFFKVSGLHSASRGSDLNARRKILNSYKMAVAGIIFGTVMFVIVFVCGFFL